MSETPNQITRREILKRGAFVGGAVVWATPVVQTLGMGRAFAQTPSDVCVPSWAAEVYSASQGLQKSGDGVLPERSNPNNALGGPLAPPENPGPPQNEVSYFSLGYGGELIVKLGVPYYSGKSGEALVIETTDGTYPLETADVWVSQNALPGSWIYVGSAANTGSPALQASLDSVLPAPPPANFIQYVKLKDTTNRDIHNSTSDGFDVNAVGISCPTIPQ